MHDYQEIPKIADIYMEEMERKQINPYRVYFDPKKVTKYAPLQLRFFGGKL